MFGQHDSRGRPRPLALVGVATLVAGCASADKNASTAASGSGSSTSASSSSMPGMNMGSGATSAGKPISVDGIKPVPTQVLATATWQGMRITARGDHRRAVRDLQRDQRADGQAGDRTRAFT